LSSDVPAGASVFFTLLTVLLLQVPNADWQPILQYASVDPHQPDEEQQSPNPEPLQV
jgi:hypothetical protein